MSTVRDIYHRTFGHCCCCLYCCCCEMDGVSIRWVTLCACVCDVHVFVTSLSLLRSCHTHAVSMVATVYACMCVRVFHFKSSLIDHLLFHYFFLIFCTWRFGKQFSLFNWRFIRHTISINRFFLFYSLENWIVSCCRSFPPFSTHFGKIKILSNICGVSDAN